MGWELLGAFCVYLSAIGRPRTTVDQRRWQIDYMARTMGTPAAAVSIEDLLGFFAAHPHWARETRRSFRSAARSFFAWACEYGHIATNPAAALPTMKPGQLTVKPCTDAVYRAALGQASPREALMLRLAMEAGLRRGEIAALHRRDLSRGPGGWELFVRGKGGRERIVPIHDGLADDLIACEGWVFPSRQGGHLDPRYVGEICSALLGSTTTLHQLRHAFATRAYRGSRNIRAVQQLLGHTSLATTERYLATDETERREAMMAALNPQFAA